jgi:drug/metabolite transporter (DMT)-like permease
MENNTVGKKNLRSGIVFSGLSAFLSGMYIPLSKLMLNYLPTRLQGGIAYMSAGLFALLIFMIRILDKRCKPEEKPKGKEWLAIACIAVVDCFALFFFYQGFDTTSSNVSSLIAVTELLLTALLATILFECQTPRSHGLPAAEQGLSCL